MSASREAAEAWGDLSFYGDTYTCYSAALATWLASAEDDWASVVNPGLWLRITEAQDGLSGFAYFPPGLRARLGLVSSTNRLPPATGIRHGSRP